MLDEGAQEVLRAVQSGDADLGLSFTGASHPELDFEPLVTEDYVLAVPRDHALASRASLSWRALVDLPMVAVAGDSGNRVLIDQVWSRLPRRLEVRHEANHVSGALALVAAGLGAAVVPRLALSEDGAAPAHLVGVPLRQPRLQRTLGLLSRRGRQPSAAATALAQALREAVGLSGAAKST